MDQVFPRKRKQDFGYIEPSIYKVTGYSDTENMWEYLHQIGIVKGPASQKAPPYNLYRLQQNVVNQLAKLEINKQKLENVKGKLNNEEDTKNKDKEEEKEKEEENTKGGIGA